MALSPPPPQPPRVIHNTVHQTVVHLHQTNHQHILNRVSFVRALSQGVPMAVIRPVRACLEEDDPSRPARAARRLVRLLSTESARRVLRPFFRDVLSTLLREERKRWYDRPRQSLLVLWSLLGWRQESHAMGLRYALHERAVEERLCRLPAAPHAPSVRGKLRRTAEPGATHRPSEPLAPPHLSKGEFQALVQGVSAALDRRARLETLRRGGW